MCEALRWVGAQHDGSKLKRRLGRFSPEETLDGEIVVMGWQHRAEAAVLGA
jgi:hypothetical protein